MEFANVKKDTMEVTVKRKNVMKVVRKEEFAYLIMGFVNVIKDSQERNARTFISLANLIAKIMVNASKQQKNKMELK